MKLITQHWIDIRDLELIEEDGKVVGIAVTKEIAGDLVRMLRESGLITLTTIWPEATHDWKVVGTEVKPEDIIITPTMEGIAALAEEDQAEEEWLSRVPEPPAAAEPLQVDPPKEHPPAPRLVLDQELVSRSPQREAIRQLVGVVQSKYSPDDVLKATRMRLAGKSPSEIAAALGLPSVGVGGLMKCINRHVDALIVHPDPEWREIYLAELAYAVKAGAKS